MKKLVDLFLRPKDESQDWTLFRLRALEDRRIGPRYPAGMFVLYDPHDPRVI